LSVSSLSAALGPALLPLHDALPILKLYLARSLGRILDRECGLGGGLVCLDGIKLATLDFIDIGPRRRDVHPVVIPAARAGVDERSEEHTAGLQALTQLLFPLLLVKK